jgi:hypothetical protein
MSSKLKDKIQNLMKNDAVGRHSYFQLKYFVIGKEPTTQAKLWRCIRELESRNKSLQAIELEIEDAKDDIELLHIDINKTSPFGVDVGEKQKKILIRKNERKTKALVEKLNDLKNKKRYIEEEATFFVQAFESLEKIEKIKPFDDLDAQTEYWNEKLKQELNLNMILRQPFDTELTKTILALDNKMPVKQTMCNVLETLRGTEVKKPELENKEK